MVAVVLLERIEKLGQMGQVVNVKPGFARNYLLPQKKALRATKGSYPIGMPLSMNEYEALFRHLTNQPEVTPPTVGPLWKPARKAEPGRAAVPAAPVVGAGLPARRSVTAAPSTTSSATGSKMVAPRKWPLPLPLGLYWRPSTSGTAPSATPFST